MEEYENTSPVFELELGTKKGWNSRSILPSGSPIPKVGEYLRFREDGDRRIYKVTRIVHDHTSLPPMVSRPLVIIYGEEE